MDLDDLFFRYFGRSDPAAVEPAALAAGVDRLRVEFGLERDRGRRFALWALMHMLGVAPDLDVAFRTEADRDAARDFMDIAARAGDEGERGVAARRCDSTDRPGSTVLAKAPEDHPGSPPCRPSRPAGHLQP